MHYMILERLKIPMRKIGSSWRPLRVLQVHPDANLLRAACQAVLRIFSFLPRVNDLRTPVWTNFFRYHRSTESVIGSAAVRK